MWFYSKTGLPLDKTIAKVCKVLGNFHPDLSEELYLTSWEMRAGMRWDEALCSLSERTGMDEIKALTGTGLLGILQAVRMQSDSLRAARCQRLKRQAIKRGFVMALFLVPPLFLVTLGPETVELFRQLSQGR